MRALSFASAGFTRLYFLLPLAGLALHVAAFLQPPATAQLALPGISA